MIIHECEQGTPEWIALRLGIPTASNFHKIITPARGELSKQRFAYMRCLVAETLLGEPTESFVETEWMARGKLLEAEAAGHYEFQHDVTTKKVGFITTDDGQIGASPDRLVFDTDGALVAGLEVKCPAPQTQIEYWEDGFGDDYKCQAQGQCLVAELEYVDRWAYHPKFPRVLGRTHRDEAFIEKLSAALRQFNDERLALIERLRATGMFTEQVKPKAPIDTAYDPDDLDRIMSGYGSSNLIMAG